MKKDPEFSKPSFLHIAWSLIAAFCGVQNDSNLDRDNSHIEKHGCMPYIIIGMTLTILYCAGSGSDATDYSACYGLTAV
jgi:hypothetical protein